MGGNKMTWSVAASFDRAAPKYRRYAGVQAALAQWVAEWLPEWRPDRVLEIGAGTGLLTQRLLERDWAVTATDISPAMCAIGRATSPQADWRTMAAEAPLEGPWDCICSSGMLQWLHAPEEVFPVWRDRLAPGGRIVAGLFAAESLPELRAIAGEIQPLTWRSPETWHACLERAGLRVRRDEVALRSFRHESAHAFLRTLHGVGAAPVRRFNPGRLRALLREYETRFGAGATWTFYRFEAERAD